MNDYWRILKAIRCPDPICKGEGVNDGDTIGAIPCDVCGGTGLNPAVRDEHFIEALLRIPDDE